jgi:hypothetical protein
MKKTWLLFGALMTVGAALQAQAPTVSFSMQTNVEIRPLTNYTDNTLAVGKPWDVNKDGVVDLVEIFTLQQQGKLVIYSGSDGSKLCDLVVGNAQNSQNQANFLGRDNGTGHTYFLVEIVNLATFDAEFRLLKIDSGFTSVQSLTTFSFVSGYIKPNVFDLDGDGFEEYMLREGGKWNVYSLSAFLTNLESNPSLTGDASFSLLQNYPNPFNPNTNVSFNLKFPGRVKLEIHDANGRLVQTVIDRNFTTGQHTIPVQGQNLSSGTYFYTLYHNELQQTKKMTLIK